MRDVATAAESLCGWMTSAQISPMPEPAETPAAAPTPHTAACAVGEVNGQMSTHQILFTW